MENTGSANRKEKASEMVAGKASIIVNQLEGIYSMLSEAVDRLGGQGPPNPDAAALKEGGELPGVVGDSFLNEINIKVIRIQELVNSFEAQISRLSNLV